MKIILPIIIASSLTIILTTHVLESVYAQSDRDILQEWKDYVESYKKYMEKYKQWAYDRFDDYEKHNSYYESEISRLKLQIQQLQSEIFLLNEDNFELKTDALQDELVYESQKQLLDKYKDELTKQKEINKKPRTYIENQEYHITVYDTKGNDYYWTLPVETYEKYVDFDEQYEYRDLSNSNTGKTHTIVKLAPFVIGVFDDVIDDIYDNSENNNDFILEVWHIVSQLTIYSSELEETPRYAIETLVRGGGDCEDLVILIADMLRSSKHTSNWEMKIVAIDSDNPTKPKNVNHVILYVDDGEYVTFIEATQKPSWDYYPDGISGWNEVI